MNSLMRLPPLVVTLAATSCLIPQTFATNGMNMEGYGPIATAMGGASLAYYNGTAGVITNPATLSLMEDQAQLDIALGFLGPDVSSKSSAGEPSNSSATAFYMPAFGYARQAGDYTYGLAIFGQGGMGTEYDPDSWSGLGFGLVNRTEVSVGRVILPLAYQVNEKLHIGGSIDYVWAGMDLQMAMTGAQFFDFVDPSQQNFGHASGSLVQGFFQIMGQMPPGTAVDYAYFNFTNNNDFTGEATGNGIAGKIGLTYDVTEQFTVGLTYHSQTDLGDLKAPGNSLAFQLNVPGMGQLPQAVSGDFEVRNFQWPALFGVGIAYRPQPQWLIVADIRQIMWKDVMKEFSMNFTADSSATNGPFANTVMDAVHYQNWNNQTVFQVGAAYHATENLVLRGGFNYSNNPVPNTYLNSLFPAIIEQHYTAGLGYRLNERSSIDLSLTYAPEVSVLNGRGVDVRHAQLNSQLMYSYRF